MSTMHERVARRFLEANRKSFYDYILAFEEEVVAPAIIEALPMDMVDGRPKIAEPDFGTAKYFTGVRFPTPEGHTVGIGINVRPEHEKIFGEIGTGGTPTGNTIEAPIGDVSAFVDEVVSSLPDDYEATKEYA